MFKNFILIKDLILLKPKAIQEIAFSKNSTIDGILILFLISLASIIGSIRTIQNNPTLFQEFPNLSFNLNFVLSSSIFAVFFLSLIIIFSFLISKTVGGENGLLPYFRVSAFAQIVNLVNLFPEISFLSLWIIFIQFHILKNLNKLSAFNSFLILITTILALFALFSSLI